MEFSRVAGASFPREPVPSILNLGLRPSGLDPLGSSSLPVNQILWVLAHYPWSLPASLLKACAQRILPFWVQRVGSGECWVISGNLVLSEKKNQGLFPHNTSRVPVFGHERSQAGEWKGAEATHSLLVTWWTHIQPVDRILAWKRLWTPEGIHLHLVI